MLPLLGAGIGGDLLGSVGGFAGNLAIMAGAAGKGGEDTIREIVNAWRNLKLADYDFRKLDPPTLKIFAEYIPELWEAEVPDDVKVAVDSPEMRAAQVRGVQRLEQVAQEGLPLEDRLATNRTMNAVARETGRDQANLRAELAARRGLSASDDLALQLKGQQGAAAARATMGSDLLRDSLARRYDAVRALPGVAGAVRGQDIDLSRTNANLINNFNMDVASMRNAAAAANAAARERAGFANASTRQRVGEANVMNRYGNQVRNQEYGNQMRQQRFRDEVTRLGGLSDALGSKAEMEELRRQERAQAIRSLGKSTGQAAGGGAGLLGLFG